MTCSQTGGIEGGSGGVIKVGMVEEGLAGGVEASEGGVVPKGVSGDTKPLGGCGHDGGWELVVEGKPGSRFQNEFFLKLGLGLER